jgi:hypothetical protein
LQFEHKAELIVLGNFPTDNSYKTEAAHNRNAIIEEVLANDDTDPKKKKVQQSFI